MLKEKFLGLFMLIGSGISYLLGGWTELTTTLLMLMCIDFLTGFILSAVFKKSTKTDTGGLNSQVGFLGLFKKMLILVFVLIGYRLDITLDVHYIRDGVCYAFILNEIVSLIENCGLIGFPIQK
jgi:toxin secretion/phage lysis holin